MESSTATHPFSRPPVDRGVVDGSAASGSTNRAKQRGSVLARMLYVGDSVAAFCAAGIAVIVLGLQSWQGLAFVFATTGLWPLAAFSIGLYRSDQLASWASAVTEIPRGFVAVLLITWPLFGIAAGAGGRAGDDAHLPHRLPGSRGSPGSPGPSSAPASTGTRSFASGP